MKHESSMLCMGILLLYSTYKFSVTTCHKKVATRTKKRKMVSIAKQVKLVIYASFLT